jgi:hypothetical protein
MPLPVLAQNSKDWLQAIAWIAATLGAVVAAFKFWSELRLGREQRAQELRWKRAQAGKALNDEMMDDPLAWPAMQMLDYPGTSFELPSKSVEVIERSDLRFALDPNNKASKEKHVYIRKCFDSLFYYMATMEHYTASTLVDPEDIAFPLEYYVPLLAEFRDVVDAYTERYHLERVRLFLNRYPTWIKTDAPNRAATA